MEKNLCRSKNETYYIENEQKIIGTHNRISGNVSRISGNIDMCHITTEERNTGIDIKNLVKEE